MNMMPTDRLGPHDEQHTQQTRHAPHGQGLGGAQRNGRAMRQETATRALATHHAWNSGVELNMRATPTMQNLRTTSTRRHQNSSGRNRLEKQRFASERAGGGVGWGGCKHR
jgi:hypothetical protein